MSFKAAERVARLLYAVTAVLLVFFILCKDNKPVVAWSCFGGVLVCSIIMGTICFKYMRCTGCGHVIPAVRRIKDKCPSCGAVLEYGLNGELITTAPKRRR